MDRNDNKILIKFTANLGGQAFIRTVAHAANSPFASG